MNEEEQADIKPKDPYRTEKTAFLISLIKARQKQHLSQADLARKLNMQQSAISRIESGKGNPSLKTLLAIAQALNSNLVVE